MPELLMLQGLSGSGKSTYAKELVATGKGEWKRINKDLLRLMLDEGKWSRNREKSIISARNALASELLSNSYNVIIDDTNFAPIHEKVLREIAISHNADFHIKLIDTDLETCLERNRQRPQLEQVPERVILEMYKKYIPKPSWQSGSIDCIIVDIDGTVADFTGIRGAYDQEKCDQDKPVTPIIELVHRYKIGGSDSFKVVFMSGRHGTETIRRKTKIWLQNNFPGMEFELFMRKEGDNRSDCIVKLELFMENIANIYNPHFVVDDRPKVTRMFRHTLGLTVLQVNDIEF